LKTTPRLLSLFINPHSLTHFDAIYSELQTVTLHKQQIEHTRTGRKTAGHKDVFILTQPTGLQLRAAGCGRSPDTNSLHQIIFSGSNSGIALVVCQINSRERHEAAGNRISSEFFRTNLTPREGALFFRLMLWEALEGSFKYLADKGLVTEVPNSKRGSTNLQYIIHKKPSHEYDILTHLKTKRRPFYLKTQSVPRC